MDVVELPDEDELELPLDPDVVVDVLAVAVAWVPADGLEELAPAASMPMPRLKPAAPATTAAATTGCLSFITCPFAVASWAPSAHLDSQRRGDKTPP